MPTRQCENCGKLFSSSSRAKTCSLECRSARKTKYFEALYAIKKLSYKRKGPRGWNLRHQKNSLVPITLEDRDDF